MDELKKIIQDIKAIAFHISNAKTSQERKKEGTDIKMDDLSHKLNQLSELYGRHITNDSSEKQSQEREQINIAIISVIPTEFEALDKIFNFKKNDPIKMNNGLRAWKCNFEQKTIERKNLSLIFALIGNAGNLSSYVIADLLLKTYKIKLIILCGIAAGNSEKISIYSSIIGEKIIYYENQKLMPKGVSLYRFEPLSISSNLLNEIRSIDENKWKETFIEILKRNKKNVTKSEMKQVKWIKNDWKKKLTISVSGILAGEKLFADGETFLTLAKKAQIGKEIVAGEMEGYGFAYACKQNNQSNWLVIRGISDFGGKEKANKINQKYQIIAALASASLVYYYLENVYSEND